MAKVYRTSVFQYGGREPTIHRDTGETLLVEGEPFVRLAHSTLVPMGADWLHDQRAADCVAVNDLLVRRALIDALIDDLTAVPGRSGCPHPAAGKAPPAVAT